VEAALVESLGKDFPGSAGLRYFRETIETPVTLEDFVRTGWQEITARRHSAAAVAGQGKLEHRAALLREGPQIQLHS